MNKTTFSFELFPPKTEKAAENLWAALPDLVSLNPKFMTVTYGAGGTTKEGTSETINQIMGKYKIPVGSHLTFINSTKSDLRSYIDDLWNKNVRHIVALRGDMSKVLNWPLDQDSEYFQYTSDFVEGIKTWYPEMEISVGAYPEKHPDAPSMEADITALKDKCDAGATRAITQLFFENKDYYYFIEKCEKAGINTPIVPGLLPIHDFKGMCNFAKRCHARIPVHLYERFEPFVDKPEDAQKLAIQILMEQAEDLTKHGVEHIHFYTLNKSDITKNVVKTLFS
ncbi:MAG: methylenetetrahydrofolate reductase [NAD(P)H] [Alphaproteobacteria bacterium]|nr:methylenetetrahydrofolate reductase [NAD(P)H] [Alphaproteobacteria bacterium]